MIEMSKKQALTEFHRGSILAAAERLFAEKGTEKTTMDDIAREAEYSKATLYVYFQSKEEIINAILLSGMVLLKKKIHEAIESHSDWYQAYDAVCRAIVRFYDENPTAYDAATGAMPLSQASDEAKKGVADIQRVNGEINEELAAFLVRGAAEGAVRSQLPPMETVLLFWSALSGMVHTAELREEYIGTAIGLSGRSSSSTAAGCSWPPSPRSTRKRRQAANHQGGAAKAAPPLLCPPGFQPQRIGPLGLHVAHPPAGLPCGPAHVGVLHPPGGHRHADGGAGQNTQAHALQKRMLGHCDSPPSRFASGNSMAGSAEKTAAKYCVSIAFKV